MILKRVTIYLSVLIVISACHDLKKPKKPDNLISKEKMVNVLIDAKIISSSNSVNRKIMEDHGINFNTYVYEKHNIDSLQFALSNEYYAFYIKDYEEIFLKVKDCLEILKVKFKKEEEEERKEKEERRKDSLRLVFTEKDSLMLLKIKDSLKVLKVKDSVAEMLVEKRLKEIRSVIDSISDKDPQE
ncbi:DUF4296 domain-containing protein [Flavivirga rizhaonensis]|uniref:DUF4296 domain-containing protein n=1 Tax=Flavivirga rizhaonensis TaxID=2559571 RepID=A0A4S1DXH1_9FLAO|nr:DUF4296 domain-containing protein [Flavivirga rizhaonensis]TGV02847.1 DUF4296 domain-containing protein [Flavivirga rizhaonensis]